MRRRQLLRGLGLAAPGMGVLAGCETQANKTAATPGETPFLHGVASGDPLTDRVILWTRVSPTANANLGSVEVRWWVAQDAEGTEVISQGRQQTSSERDFTVKVDAAGLQPDQRYFYGFESLGWSSPVGRTRTLPAGDVEQVRLAVTSCANHPQGFFNAYGHIAQRDDLNAVLSLGDYLYEYANSDYGNGTELGYQPQVVGYIFRAEPGQYRPEVASLRQSLWRPVPAQQAP